MEWVSSLMRRSRLQEVAKAGLATSSLAWGPHCYCCYLWFRVYGPHWEALPCPCSQLLETLTLPGLVPSPRPAEICHQISRLWERVSVCSLLMISNFHRPIWQTMKKGSQRTRSSLKAELVTPTRQKKHSLLKVPPFLSCPCIISGPFWGKYLRKAHMLTY